MTIYIIRVTQTKVPQDWTGRPALSAQPFLNGVCLGTPAGISNTGFSVVHSPSAQSASSGNSHHHHLLQKCTSYPVISENPASYNSYFPHYIVSLASMFTASIQPNSNTHRNTARTRDILRTLSCNILSITSEILSLKCQDKVSERKSPSA